MSTFSERYGYVVKPLQLESMTIELRNRIWNIYRCEICNDIAVIDSHYLEEIMDACGLSYTSVYDNADLDKNLAVFRKWYDQAEWYRIYDFVEIYLAFLPTKDLSDAIDILLNRCLKCLSDDCVIMNDRVCRTAVCQNTLVEVLNVLWGHFPQLESQRREVWPDSCFDHVRVALVGRRCE